MPDTIDAVRKLITDRLRELEAETNELERAVTSMGEKAAPRASAPKPRQKRANRKARRRSQAPRGQRREQLLAAIKAKPVPVPPSSPPRSASRRVRSRPCLLKRGPTS